MNAILRGLVEWALVTFPGGHYLHILALRGASIDGEEEAELAAAKAGWDAHALVTAEALRLLRLAHFYVGFSVGAHGDRFGAVKPCAEIQAFLEKHPS